VVTPGGRSFVGVWSVASNGGAEKALGLEAIVIGA
jgi:hypothetical protein